MQTGPKVSVLIPTYNYAGFLDETIQSVLNQTYTDFELIIVDNCSTDNTQEVVQKYLNDKRVSFVVNERNLGLVGNWNRCLELAQGEYIKFLCADDKFHPQLLEKFVPVMEQYPNVALITTFNELFGVRNFQRKAPYVKLVSGRTVRKNIIEEGAKNWLCGPTAVMFRRSGLVVGKFNPNMYALLDLEYWMRLLTLGDCYVIPESLAFFRSHGKSVTAKLRKKKFESAFELYRFASSIKAFNTQNAVNDIPSIDALVRLRASRCAAIMYKLLPKIYKKENRAVFQRAWEIGVSEHVIFDPLLRFWQRKYIRKPAQKKLKVKA